MRFLIMRIALINENSQAAKNDLIYSNLKKVAESKGHTVDNYGMSLAYAIIFVVKFIYYYANNCLTRY